MDGGASARHGRRSTFNYHTFPLTSEEDTMYGCNDNDQCCDTPEPAPAADTLKCLRASRKYHLKQLKHIGKEVAAAKAQDKRNRKNAALAVAQAKQQTADRDTALDALREIVKAAPKAEDRLNAATALIDYTGGI